MFLMFFYWIRREIINLKMLTLETWELKLNQTFDIHILVWKVHERGKRKENHEKIVNKIMFFLIKYFSFIRIKHLIII